MIFIAGRLWDHFLMILEVAKKREEKEEREARQVEKDSGIRAKLFRQFK